MDCLEGPTLLISMQGHYVALACSRHGSRVLDAIWGGAALGARKEIAAELGEYPISLWPFQIFPSLTPNSWVVGKWIEILQRLQFQRVVLAMVLSSLLPSSPLLIVQPCAPTPPPSFCSLESEGLTLS